MSTPSRSCPSTETKSGSRNRPRSSSGSSSLASPRSAAVRCALLHPGYVRTLNFHPMWSNSWCYSCLERPRRRSRNLSRGRFVLACMHSESSRFFGSLVVVLGAMAVLALAETVVPLRRDGEARRRHLRANLGLTAAYLLLNFVMGVGAAVAFDALGAHGCRLLSGYELPKVALIATGIVALDFSSYVAHWLMHHAPALWRVHRVHHVDPFVDVTTAFRQHPLEGLIRFVFTMAPAWVLGLPVEAIAIYRLLSAANAVLEHANVRVWRPLDSALSLAIVTPNMHKVHHSRLQRETDSNYGNILSFFDRVFRTFTPTARAPTIEYGLDGYDTTELQRVSKLMRLPFEGEVAAAVMTSRLRGEEAGR